MTCQFGVVTGLSGRRCSTARFDLVRPPEISEQGGWGAALAAHEKWLGLLLHAEFSGANLTFVAIFWSF